MNRDNAGKVWLTAEYDQLKIEFQARMRLDEIADAHGRTAGSVLAKMVALGLLTDRNGAYHRVEQDPWTSYHEARLIDRG